MKYKLFGFLFILFLMGCESRYDKCLRRYIDEEGYSYDEACEQCDIEEEANYEQNARR